MNKLSISFLIIVLAAIMVVELVGCGSSPKSVPAVFEGCSIAGLNKSEPTEIQLDIELPKMPDKLMAYNIATDLGGDYAGDTAQRLGFYDEIPLIGGERQVYSFTKDDQSLEIHPDGYLRFEQKISISDIPKQLPSDQQCIEIASKWLEDNGLFPSNITRTVVGYGGMSVAAIDPESGKAGSPVYYSKMVSFISAVGEFEGYALGAYVLVGDGGKIVQAEINAPQFNEYSQVPLKTPQAAFDILKNYLSRLTPVAETAPECLYNMDGIRVVINKITLRYVKTSKNGFILPVYLFEGEVQESKGSAAMERFVGQVDAVQR